MSDPKPATGAVSVVTPLPRIRPRTSISGVTVHTLIGALIVMNITVLILWGTS